MSRTPRLPSSHYSFDRGPSVSIPRCSLRRPSSYKTTFSEGALIPFFVDEVIPGDTFVLDQSVIARLATPLVPFMDNLYIDCQFFFVPYRLVWQNWEKMHGAQDNPGDSTDYTAPQIISGLKGCSVGSIYDYMGIRPGVRWSTGDVNVFPFRAYNLIWNEWYRDENLQNSITVKTDDSDDQMESYSLLPRGKRKDYFTGCLPWPQKGPELTLPLSGDVPVIGTGNALGLSRAAGKTNLLLDDRSSAGAHSLAMSTDRTSTASVGTAGTYYNHSSTSSTPATVGVTTDPALSGLKALTSLASSSSINELRQAFQLQRLLERDALGGTRYVELLATHFGVRSPDARLQRPELLGSYTVPIQLHTVPQTGGSEESGTVKTPQANLSAYGMAVSMRRSFAKSFVEFGCVIGLCSVRSDLTYQQGIPRMFSRKSRFDWYYPVLGHLGPQAVLNKEIFAQGQGVVDSDGVLVDDKAFGYQERWAEYKYGVSKVTGELRSDYAQSLDFWHLAQKFDSLPTLSGTFIEDHPPIDRVSAVVDAPHFILDVYNDLKCVRPMSLYSTPGLIDHF